MDSPHQDLDACAREPIHIPGSIQPHGALFVMRHGDWMVVRASDNLGEYLGEAVRLAEPPCEPVSKHLSAINEWYSADAEQIYQSTIGDLALSLVAHKSGKDIVVEVERVESRAADEIFASLRRFTQKLGAQMNVVSSLQAAAEFIHDLTGFDRVLVYRFSDDWHGHVVAEANSGRLPVYLDLRFPSGDIPAQARALYTVNRLRIIPNASYIPVPIRAVAGTEGEPLDLSFAQLRSVAPVHVEYMRNMGTGASMSVSIIVEGKLWGLIACHSVEAHPVSHSIREICDFVGQSLAMRIASLLQAEQAAARVDLAAITGRLLNAMASSADWTTGLLSAKDALLAQVNATGAAVVTEDGIQSVGAVPDEAWLKKIAERLDQQRQDEIIATNSLASMMDDVEDIADVASGILAVSISQLHRSWLIWFRPEVVRTVTWGGNPHKVVRESGRIHPRKSFEAWQEMVRRESIAWSAAELAAARDFRAAIVGVVLRKAEELAQLTTELQRSNKELEAFSYSISHDLRAPFRHIVGFAQLLKERETALDAKSGHYLQTISDAALSAGRLVDDLLNFSQLGRASIVAKPVDMNKLVTEVVKSVQIVIMDRKVEWSIGRLPDAWGDATLIRQVWFNLIDNAVKYTAPRDVARINVQGWTEQGRTVYRVGDNGVGFDMAYVGKLFGVFQRLQRAEDFEGTGIGLALARRIIERHNGTIDAQGEVDGGASFTFILPVKDRKERVIA